MDRLVTLSKIITALGPIKGEKSLQKLIYLNESYGNKLGYQFSWNNYGPISFHLQEEIQEIQTLGLISISQDHEVPVYAGTSSEDHITAFWKQQLKEHEIPPHSQKLISFLKELGKKRDDPLFLEIMASLDYIQRQLTNESNIYQELTKNRCSKTVFEDAEKTLQQLQVYE